MHWDIAKEERLERNVNRHEAKSNDVKFAYVEYANPGIETRVT
jgi:hypothetical protein